MSINNKIKYGSEDLYISQLENCINPYNTCNCTTMANALTYLGYNEKFSTWFPKGMKETYASEKGTSKTTFRLSDKFTYFCLTDSRVLKYYKDNYKNDYSSWKESFDAQKEDGKNFFGASKETCYRFPDVTPPNEMYCVLVYAINTAYKDCFKTTEDVCFYGPYSGSSGIDDIYEDINNIYEILKQGSPVLTSVKYGKLSHIILLSGIDYVVDEYNNVTCNKLYVDDPYGNFDPSTKKYTSIAGKTGYNLEYDLTWVNYIKEVNNYKNKRCVYFKPLKKS